MSRHLCWCLLFWILRTNNFHNFDSHHKLRTFRTQHFCTTRCLVIPENHQMHEQQDGYQRLHFTALNGFSMGVTSRKSYPSCDYCWIISPMNYFNARSHVWPVLRQSRNKMEVVRTEVQRKGKRSYPSVQLLSLGDIEGGGVKRDRRVPQCES